MRENKQSNGTESEDTREGAASLIHATRYRNIACLSRIRSNWTSRWCLAGTLCCSIVAEPRRATRQFRMRRRVGIEQRCVCMYAQDKIHGMIDALHRHACKSIDMQEIYSNGNASGSLATHNRRITCGRRRCWCLMFVVRCCVER